MFALIGLLPLLHGASVRIWSLSIGSFFAIAAFAVPGMLAPLNRLWMKFGRLLHRFVSPIVLGLLFFLVITPMGLAINTAEPGDCVEKCSGPMEVMVGQIFTFLDR